MAGTSEGLDVQIDDKAQLYELVEELTTSGESKLDEKSLKSLKSLCKKSNEDLANVYHIILNQMEKDHAEIRLSCFQIIDELFVRSHAFRQMVLNDFHSLLELCVETNDERKLPPPKSAAKVLKSTALSNIENWHQKFGKHYKKLEIGYDFLKRVKRIDFAGMRSSTLLERQRQESLEARQRDLEKRTIEKIKQEMQESCLDIESAILQGNSCLHLVLPRPCDLYTDENSVARDEASQDTQCDSVTGETITSSSNPDNLEGLNTHIIGKYHGIPTKDYKITIKISLGKTVVVESDENKDILANLYDLMNEIRNKFAPMVNRWINILTKCSNVNDELAKCMHFKSSLKELTEKYNDIQIDQPEKLSGDCKYIDEHNNNDDDDDNDDDDTDTFEDVPEAEDANFESWIETATSSETSKVNPNKWRNASSFMACSDKEKSVRLKKIAPVVPFDNDLKYWGSKKLHITPITKNDSLHKFWSHGEVNDDFVPDSLEASLRNGAISFTGEFKKVEWKCRAPMSNGKLCERQDRYKCPFHGRVIPRDEFGSPTNPENLAADNERKQKLAEEELNEIYRDVETTVGKDLVCRNKKKKLSIRKQRYSRLTNLKTVTNTSRKRLENKVLQKGALRRVDEALTAIEKRRNLEKFGSHFNYHYEY